MKRPKNFNYKYLKCRLWHSLFSSPHALFNLKSRLLWDCIINLSGSDENVIWGKSTRGKAFDISFAFKKHFSHQVMYDRFSSWIKKRRERRKNWRKREGWEGGGKRHTTGALRRINSRSWFLYKINLLLLVHKRFREHLTWFPNHAMLFSRKYYFQG